MKEQAELLDKFGRFDFGFDFGAPVKTPANLASFLPEDPASYRARAFVLANTLAPRFLPVDPDMRYADSRGYGWTSDGRRAAEAIPLTPYLEIRAVAKNPANLPHDVLYRDYIRGTGARSFLYASRTSGAAAPKRRRSSPSQIEFGAAGLKLSLPQRKHLQVRLPLRSAQAGNANPRKLGQCEPKRIRRREVICLMRECQVEAVETALR